MHDKFSNLSYDTFKIMQYTACNLQVAYCESMMNLLRWICELLKYPRVDKQNVYRNT